MNINKLLPIILVVCVAMGAAAWYFFSSSATSSNKDAISVAWKTIPLPDENGTSHVDVFLVLSGAMKHELSVGKFAGQPHTASLKDSEDALLAQSWWAGSEHALFVQQKDMQHLAVLRTPLNNSKQTPPEEITVIQIPTGTFLAPAPEKNL